ncbi:MAG TPA: hypothetical protein PLG43_00135 [Spirochaetia bacterium]|nr:hypothetical protein [Spirochaetia bacterium]
MKRISTAMCLFLVLGVYGFSMDIGGMFHFGNLTLDQASTAPVADFDGTEYDWGVSVFGSEKLSDKISIDAGLYYDPVLKYTTYTLFEYDESFFSIGVGPFFGLFNTMETPLKSGISTTFRVELPGVVFASFRADSSIGGRLIKEGDYIQERNEVSLGFYVPNAIVSLNLITKDYAEKAASREIDTSFTEYSFKTEVFQKNIPYRFLLSFGYQKLVKTFADDSDTSDNTIHSLVLGTDINADLSKALSLLINLESSIYTFGYKDGDLISFPESGPGIYLFRASVGFVVHTDGLKNTPSL